MLFVSKEILSVTGFFFQHVIETLSLYPVRTVRLRKSSNMAAPYEYLLTLGQHTHLKQFFDFIHYMVFDFTFYCLAMNTTL